MKARPDDGGRLIILREYGSYRVPASKPCATCGKPYRPLTNRQRYCSHDCKRYRDTFMRRLFRHAAKAMRPLPYTLESAYMSQLDAAEWREKDRKAHGWPEYIAPPRPVMPVFRPPKRCSHILNGIYLASCDYCRSRSRPDAMPRYYGTPVVDVDEQWPDDLAA
jgi:hypothetical protein